MDDVFSKVQIIRRGSKPPVVVVSMLQPDGTFYRESAPLDKGSDIRAVVSKAFSQAKEAHESHLRGMTNPLGVDMSSGVE